MGPYVRHQRGVGFGISLGLIATMASAGPAAAQVGPVRGYSLTAASASERSLFADGGSSMFQRVRLMSAADIAAFSLEVAYEHGLVLNTAATGAAPIPGAAITPTATDWLDLSWIITDDDHARWTHRLDRITLGLSGHSWDFRMGRQAISWATTLFLTPGDPFSPFDPSDPFREYRAGVDAARFRYYPGALSELDLVLRPVDTASGTTMTALLRGRASLVSTDLSVWVGAVHDEFGLGVGASRSVAGFELRAEGSVRRDPSGTGMALRSAIGVDRRLSVAARDLYLVVEYAHDDFAAARASDLVSVLVSKPFSRGELQSLGRDEMAVSGTLQPHPLWECGLLNLVNLRDGSALLVPAVSYAAGANVSLRGGAFLPVGSSGLGPQGLKSEYGSAPLTGYFSATWFF